MRKKPSYLVLPHPSGRQEYRVRVQWTDEHASSSYGMGVLLMPDGNVLDGAMMKALAPIGAYVEGDPKDKARLENALASWSAGLEIQEKPVGVDLNAYRHKKDAPGYAAQLVERINPPTLTNLANRLGVSEPALRGYIAGKMAMPYPVQFCLEWLASSNRP